MSTVSETLKTFEWHEIAPGSQWFDQLKSRIFVNLTKGPLKIGFSHNARTVEMIAIGVDVTKDPALEALEGKEVVEEI